MSLRVRLLRTLARASTRRATALASILLASAPLTAIGLLSTGPAHAAGEMTRFEIDFFRNASPEPINHATIWVSDQRVRIEQRRASAVEKGPVLVYRGDEDRVLSISDREQRYSQIDRRMLRMLGLRSPDAQTRSMRRAMDAQLSGLPGDQRVALERLLGISREDATAAPLTVERDTQGGTVAGIACTRVVMTRAGQAVGEACVSAWDGVGLAEADIEVFRTLANFQREALGARGVTPLEFVPDQAFDLIVQFDGFPLSFRRIVDGHERSAIRIRSISHGPADDGLFSAPPSYARRAGHAAFFAHLSSSSESRSASGSGSEPGARSPSRSDRDSLGRRAPEAAAPPAAPDPAQASPRVQPGRRADRGRGALPRPTYRSIRLFPD